MAQVIVTLKIMPDSPEADLEAIEKHAKKEIEHFGGEPGKVEIEPVAFGLKSVNIIYVVDESLGGTDPVEEAVAKIKHVNSAEVTDVRRAIG